MNFSRVRQIKETISDNNSKDGCLPKGHLHVPALQIALLRHWPEAELSLRARPGTHLYPLQKKQPRKWPGSCCKCGIPRALSYPGLAAEGFPIHLAKHLRVQEG